MNRYDFDYRGTPQEAEYFTLLPTNLCMDFGGGAASAAQGAAQAQYGSTVQARGIEQQMLDQAMQQVAPWRKAGAGALGQYAGIMNIPGYKQVDPTQALQATPGYQFQMNQGVNALDRSAASRGMLMSGPQSQALTQYGQGLANNTYGQYMDRLMGVSQQGLQAGQFGGQASMQAGQQMGQDYLMGGQALGQGIMNAYQGQQQGQQNLMGGLGSLAGIGLGLLL